MKLRPRSEEQRQRRDRVRQKNEQRVVAALKDARKRRGIVLGGEWCCHWATDDGQCMNGPPALAEACSESERQAAATEVTEESLQRSVSDRSFCACRCSNESL